MNQENETKKHSKKKSSLMEVITSFPSWVLTQFLSLFFNSKRDKSYAYSIGIISFLIVTGSFYTTYLGICYLIDNAFFALLLTMGLQGIMFITSWKYADGINQNRTPPYLLISFGISYLLSVFFSFSALLEKVYPMEERDQEELIDVRVISNSIVQSSIKSINDNLLLDKEKLLKELNSWKKQTDMSLAKSNILSNRINNYKSNVSEYNRRLDRVRQKKLYPQGGGGSGTLATMEKYARDFYFKNVKPDEGLFIEIDSFSNLISQKVLEINTGSTVATDIININNLVRNFNLSLSRVEPSMSSTIPYIRNEVINIVSIRSEEFDWVKTYKSFSIDTITTTSSIKKSIEKFIVSIPSEFGELKQLNLQRLSRMGKYKGSDVHPFVLAIDELFSFTKRVILPLFLALSMDGLVLFCGLLLAKPTSYLFMSFEKGEHKKISDIVLQNNFSLDLDSISTKTPYLKRLVEILKLTKSDTENAYKGYPLYIDKNELQNPNIAKDIGILITLEYANQNDDQSRIYLKVSFILWAVEQILNTNYTEVSLAEILNLINSNIKDNGN